MAITSLVCDIPKMALGLAKTYWSDSIVHEATGVTYYFAEPVEYGYYWNGDIFVVSNGGDVTITQITPEWSGAGRVMHGAMLQPHEVGSNEHGFDSDPGRGKDYNAFYNADPSATGASLIIDEALYPTGASLVKAISKTNRDGTADTLVEKFSVLTIVPQTPPEHAFRPPVAGTDKNSTYTLTDLDFSKLQNVASVAGQPSISNFDYLVEATYVSWWTTHWTLTDFHPEAYHNGYNDYQLDGLMGAFAALHSNYSEVEKTNLYAAVVQQGLDFAGNAAVGNTFPQDGGHGSFYKPFVVFAASALNSQDLKNFSQTEGLFSEDTSFEYVGAGDIGIEYYNFIDNQNPRVGRELQDADLGMPNYIGGIAGFLPGMFGTDPSIAYLWINADNIPITALSMEMLGNGEGREIWGNEAYFDYAERIRLMHEIDVDPAGVGAEHSAVDWWMSFLNTHHDTFSLGSTIDFRPEQPVGLTLVPIEGGINVEFVGNIFPGSSSVTRVDVRYREVGSEAWTVIQDFGTSGDIVGLTDGDAYFVQGRYVNMFEEGPWTFNDFDARNSSIFNRLKSDGFYAPEVEFGTVRRGEGYREHLRAILAGDESHSEITKDLVSNVVTLPLYWPGLGESFNFAELPVQDFLPGEQDGGGYSISADGASLMLDSQAWQAVLIPVAVTADTWLSFDFSANVEGEIHGIIFTNGNTISESTAFQVYGTQQLGVQDYAYTGAGAVQRFDIPVGAHFTGSFDRIVFFTDDDANVGADSTFANVSLTIGGPPA